PGRHRAQSQPHPPGAAAHDPPPGAVKIRPWLVPAAVMAGCALSSCRNTPREINPALPPSVEAAMPSSHDPPSKPPPTPPPASDAARCTEPPAPLRPMSSDAEDLAISAKDRIDACVTEAQRRRQEAGKPALQGELRISFQARHEQPPTRVRVSSTLNAPDLE